MRIGIDARFYGPIGKGLGRYTQKLVQNLEEIDQENQYFVFLVKENFDEYQPRNNNFHKVLADYRWYTFSEQLNMPRILKRYNLDLVHFPHFNVPILYWGNFIITIHDLILLNFPTNRGTTLNNLWYRMKFMAYKIVIWLAIWRAQKIIAVSYFTKKDILDHYRVPEEKIVVTYEACDNFPEEELISAENKDQVLKKYDIIRPYILYVGNAYPHKNLDRLISAFADVSDENSGLQLVLVGKEDYFYKRLKTLVQKKRLQQVVFAGFIPDNDLKVVYAEAQLYVFPSLYEGFGIPPLEAMAQGVPVVSSDHPCMKEILKEGASYFNGLEEKSIAESIKKALGDPNLRVALVERGSAIAKKYSWKKMATETLALYQKSK